MSTIKITTTYDVQKALVGIDPYHHPEAHRILTALRNIAVAEREAGSIYEIAGNAVSNHIKDTKIAQQASRIAQLEKSLADVQDRRDELVKEVRSLRDQRNVMVTEARLHRERADRYKAQVHNLRYPNWR